MMLNQIFKRKCPICNDCIEYKHKLSCDNAELSNKPCLNCVKRRKSLFNKDYIDNLQTMLADGYYKNDIMNILDITNAQYAYVMSKFGLKSNKKTCLKIIDDIQKIAICSRCNKTLSISCFDKTTSGSGYPFYRTYCKECRKKKRVIHVNSNINSFLKERYTRMKTHAHKCQVPFTISIQDFILQYENQNGKCFYSDIPMECVFGQGKLRYALSVDKIIPEKGYIKGNVVFCINVINMSKNDLSLEEIKQWMPDWYKRIIIFIERKCNDKEEIKNT